MSSNISAVKLIIENIQSLEQAKRLIEGEIAEKIGKALDKTIKNYIDSLEGKWEGCYDFYNDEIRFAPANWKTSNQESSKLKNFYARYYTSTESSETGCEENGWWYVSNFLINEIDHITFNFYPWWSSFKCTGASWKKFASEQNTLHPEIEKLGFKYNSPHGGWYLIVDGIKPSIFLDSYENDNLEDALQPFIDALDKLKLAHPYFDEIVQAAIKEFATE